MRQTSFLKQLGYSHDASYGGAKSLVRKRKIRRPLDSRHPVHLILKSSKAKGALSFQRSQNKMWIWRLIHAKADKFNLGLEGFANVGNHLHLKIRFRRRKDFQKFIKSITALIARHVTGARKGRKFGRFWDFLAYTKVIKVWAQEKRLNHYIIANAIEGEHGKEWRQKYLEKFNDG